MKKDIIKFLPKCPHCQQYNVEHKTGGLIIPSWKRKDLNMDFIIGSCRTCFHHDFIWMCRHND